MIKYYTQNFVGNTGIATFHCTICMVDDRVHSGK